jgi:hypothetical protein
MSQKQREEERRQYDLFFEHVRAALAAFESKEQAARPSAVTRWRWPVGACALLCFAVLWRAGAVSSVAPKSTLAYNISVVLEL